MKKKKLRRRERARARDTLGLKSMDRCYRSLFRFVTLSRVYPSPIDDKVERRRAGGKKKEREETRGNPPLRNTSVNDGARDEE